MKPKTDTKPGRSGSKKKSSQPQPNDGIRSLPRDAALPFSVEIVAKIAVELLAAGQLLPTGMKRIEDDPPNYDQAAFSAIRMLEACESRLKSHRASQQRMAEWTHEATEITRKYPEGMPFKKAVLRITGKRSEAEALPIFKEFLQHCAIPSERIDLLGSATPAMVEEKLKHLRVRGYNHMELSEEKARFEDWRNWRERQKSCVA